MKKKGENLIMKKGQKIIFLLLAFIVTTIGLTACSSNSDDTKTASSSKEATPTKSASGTARSLSEIKESGKVVIGVFSDKKPFGYVDANGDYQGYDVYFANQIAEDLDVDVEYVSLDPASRVEYLETAKVDIILANFTVTDERAEKVDFALPYMKVSLGVVSPDKEIIKNVDELKGKTLIVAKGTTADVYFTENYPDVELLKFDQYSDAYGALLDGRGDAFSTDNTEVLAWALENKGFTVGIDTLGELDTIAPAVQKGNTELLEWLNEEIVTLGKDNFFHKNFEETLAPAYGDAAKADNIVVEGGVVEE